MVGVDLVSCRSECQISCHHVTLNKYTETRKTTLYPIIWDVERAPIFNRKACHNDCNYEKDRRDLVMSGSDNEIKMFLKAISSYIKQVRFHVLPFAFFTHLFFFFFSKTFLVK